jgi:glycosyltransferase involved in cell wall biosynthesis
MFNRVAQKIITRLFLYYWKREAPKLKAERKKRTSPRLVWGPIPLLNNKYWSNALKKGGYDSTTFMWIYFENINKKEDFDLYFEDIKFEGFKKRLYGLSKRFPILRHLLIFDHVIRNYDILHIPCSGGYLWQLENWKLEYYVARMVGCKFVVIPFGGDYWRFSKVLDPSYLHGLLAHYPALFYQEKDIEERVQFWVHHADCFFPGYLIDGIGRWDVLSFSLICIDTAEWKTKASLSDHDGINGVVRVVHSPNHRFIKGTEFIIAAIDELKSEGLQVELVLIEKKKNEEVKRILFEEADIMLEQVILAGYGLSGVEGMATGLPVLSNMEDEHRTRLFRRYSYLNECPVVSASPENVKENLRALITNPSLRKQLGTAGREYVEKYHSEVTSGYMFSKVYERIWHGKPVDLINMFHPMLKDSYNNTRPVVKHPLWENRIPLQFNATVKDGHSQ